MASQACQAEACAIQSCIQKNNYNESRCTEAVKALYACCKDMYDKDPNAQSTACPLLSVVNRKLKQLERESGK